MTAHQRIAVGLQRNDGLQWNEGLQRKDFWARVSDGSTMDFPVAARAFLSQERTIFGTQFSCRDIRDIFPAWRTHQCVLQNEPNKCVLSTIGLRYVAVIADWLPNYVSFAAGRTGPGYM